LDGPLPTWCPAVALSRQDGRHSAVIKKGDNSNIKKGDNSNIKKGDNSNIK
jgi:hypothetical protein